MATNSPSISNYTKGQGRLYVGVVGSPEEGLEAVGNASAVSLEVTLEESEHFSSMAPTRVKDDIEITATAATFRATVDEITGANIARALLASVADFTQTEAAEQTIAIEGVVVGRAYELGGTNLTLTSVTDGEASPVAYSGSNYVFYGEPGIIVFTSKPDLAGANAVVTVSKPEILAAANRKALAILGATDLRARVLFFSTNTKGRRVRISLPIVRFKPAGAFGLISEDYATIEMEGEVLYDDSNPAYPMGRLDELN